MVPTLAEFRHYRREAGGGFGGGLPVKGRFVGLRVRPVWTDVGQFGFFSRPRTPRGRFALDTPGVCR